MKGNKGVKEGKTHAKTSAGGHMFQWEGEGGGSLLPSGQDRRSVLPNHSIPF